MPSFKLNVICAVCDKLRIISQARRFTAEEKKALLHRYVCSDCDTPLGLASRADVSIYPAGPPLVGQWVIAWQTSVMPAPAFWYYDTYEEACEVLVKFLF